MRPLSLIATGMSLVLLTAFTPLMYGVFRNETSSTVSITLVDVRGHAMRPHNVGPHATSRFPIIHGTAIVSAAADRRTSSYQLMPPDRLQRYYDFATRSYYYRITQQSISPVLPDAARTWHVNGSNQAMQLTAPRSVSPLSVAATFELQPRALGRGS